jgi:hypothetical protein
MLLLLPSILDGPDNVHILERSRCRIDQVSYQDNWCPRDTSQDFSNLVYRKDWEICKLVRFNISSELVINGEPFNCTWLYPQSFATEKDAFVAVSSSYTEGLEYDCVVDTVNHICYADKLEMVVFGCVVAALFLLFVGTIVGHCYVKRWLKRKQEENDKLAHRV